MPEEKKNLPHKEQREEGLGPISRRKFAMGSMVILGTYPGMEATAKDITIPAKASSRESAKMTAMHPTVVSPAAKTIRFTVNKWNYEMPVEPEWALRDVLRNQLGLLSIKDMCNGYGACGSCTVIMNGRPILSCMTLAIECDGMTIETAEGVAVARPDLIEAYVMNHCMQCGYCTPGFVVTAKALLDRMPNPTEKDIKNAIGGNICRCGTYPQHILAINEATSGRAS
jgi:aerobic-type carbon monoxide dehydrogenase small subunit (CoxS/CutS family)